MNEQELLQLQAWVDGELPEGEARRIEKQLDTDTEAQALVAELRMTKAFLAGNEPEYRVPETREFYWSKIKREIEREKPQPAGAGLPSWILGWRHLFAPLSGLALIAFLAVLSLDLLNRGQVDDALQHLVEVENLDEHIGSISYKSQSENMFVVYLYTKDQEPSEDEDFELMDDSVLQ